MKLWSSGGRLQASRRGGVEFWSSRGMLRARGRRGVGVWRCAAGVQTWRHRGMELWSSGGMLRALPQKRYGGREVRCRRADVEVKRYGAPELGSHAAGLG